MRVIKVSDVLAAAGESCRFGGGFREGNDWDAVNLYVDGVDGDGLSSEVVKDRAQVVEEAPCEPCPVPLALGRRLS